MSFDVKRYASYYVLPFLNEFESNIEPVTTKTPSKSLLPAHKRTFYYRIDFINVCLYRKYPFIISFGWSGTIKLFYFS